MRRTLEILVTTAALLVMPVLASRPIAAAAYVEVLGGAAYAVQPAEMLADPNLEKRARDISAGLRCLVCQNQSIDDSDADLAKDLRILVRQRLEAGDSDETVVDYVVARYGQFVLLKPRLTPATVLLWGAPVALVVAGGAYAVRASRRRKATATPALTVDEEAAIERLLRDRGA